MIIFRFLLPVLLVASVGVQPVQSLPEPVSFEATVAALDAHFVRHGEYPADLITAINRGSLTDNERSVDTKLDYRPLTDEDGQLRGFTLVSNNNAITVRR